MRAPPADIDDVTLDAGEREKLLRAAHDAAFPASGRKAGEPAPRWRRWRSGSPRRR